MKALFGSLFTVALTVFSVSVASFFQEDGYLSNLSPDAIFILAISSLFFAILFFYIGKVKLKG